MAQEPWVNFDKLWQLADYELEALEVEAGQNASGAFVAALECVHGPYSMDDGDKEHRQVAVCTKRAKHSSHRCL
jgi:hypothetical protein